MWGICLDSLVQGGKLYQRAIEYEVFLTNHTAHILQPISNIEISVDKIMQVERPPLFTYGEFVYPVAHPDMIGEVTDIIWHFKDNDYNYYILINGRKKGRRYYSCDLFHAGHSPYRIASTMDSL